MHDRGQGTPFGATLPGDAGDAASGDRRAHAAQARQYLTELAGHWRIEGLQERVTVAFSRRMTRNFGRCVPAQGRIVIADRLRHAPPSVFREVLCHEAAHVAVHLRHGSAARPHGLEWAALMTAAGFSARRALPALPSDPPPRRNPHHYEHRCPVCHVSRRAGRPVRQWRCIRCIAAGLDGQLEVVRVASR